MPDTCCDHKVAVIYALIDPTDGAIRYIGKTIDAKTRFRMHVWESGRNNSDKSRWMRGLADAGLEPRLAVLERVATGANWAEAEKRHIAEHRARGADLLNKTSGGQGVPDAARTEEWRANLRASHIDNPRRKDGAKRAGQKLRGRTAPPEVGAKISAANKGRKLSPEHVAKVAAAHRGKKLSAEQIEDIRRRATGHVPSEESRRKVSESLRRRSAVKSEKQKANWKDPDYRDRVQSKLRGRTITGPALENMAAATKATWCDPEVRRRRTEAIRRNGADPDYRAKLSEGLRARWQDPEFRKKMLAARPENRTKAP